MPKVRMFNERIKLTLQDDDGDVEADIFVRVDDDGDLWIEDADPSAYGTQAILVRKPMVKPLIAALRLASEF